MDGKCFSKFKEVMALRRPILHRVLDYEDEFFALLMLVLETHSMRTTGAARDTFSLILDQYKQVLVYSCRWLCCCFRGQRIWVLTVDIGDLVEFRWCGGFGVVGGGLPLVVVNMVVLVVGKVWGNNVNGGEVWASKVMNIDASFSESLYGLRRRAVNIELKKDALRSESSNAVQHSGMEKHQRVLSVVFLVVLPYFKSKLHSLYRRERETAVQASLWGPGDERFDDVDYLDVAESPVDQMTTSDHDLSSSARILRGVTKVVTSCYPWIHAGHEGM
ncbi:Peroxisome biogenesis protein 12 [Bienertia sinuspersici]